MSEERIICHCMSVSEHEILFTLKHNDTKVLDDMVQITGAGSGCGACMCEIENIIKNN